MPPAPREPLGSGKASDNPDTVTIIAMAVNESMADPGRRLAGTACELRGGVISPDPGLHKSPKLTALERAGSEPPFHTKST